MNVLELPTNERTYKRTNYIPVDINAEGITKNTLKGNIDDKACIQWFGWTYKNSFLYKEKKEEMKKISVISIHSTQSAIFYG